MSSKSAHSIVLKRPFSLYDILHQSLDDLYLEEFQPYIEFAVTYRFSVNNEVWDEVLPWYISLDSFNHCSRWGFSSFFDLGKPSLVEFSESTSGFVTIVSFTFSLKQFGVQL